MENSISILLIILIIILYLFLSGIGNLFFSYRVHLISTEKYFISGIFGAIAVFIHVVLSVFTVLFSVIQQSWWSIIVFSFFYACGNFISGIYVPKFEIFLDKILFKIRKNKNKEDNK